MADGSHPRSGCIFQTGVIPPFLPLAVSYRLWQGAQAPFTFSQSAEPMPRAQAAAGDWGVQGSGAAIPILPREAGDRLGRAQHGTGAH